MTEGAIGKVLIVGGGTAGWMAAAVLSRAFGGSLEIALVESEQIGIVGVGEATIPQIRLLNQYLGIDEDQFIRATQGSFKLGIQFEGWDRPNGAYLHAFGDVGRALGAVPFQAIWQRGLALGIRSGLWDYSLNAAAAAANRFARFSPAETQPLNGIVHAFHFDASLYARFLRSISEQAGVKRVEGRIVDVELDAESGHVNAVCLDDERRLQADLFIDCSGFRGLLIGQALGVDYLDWSDWLPCDRALALPSAHGAMMRPFTQAMARSAGWQWRIPLQHRVGNGYVYCSRFISDDEAAATLLANLEGEALDEPRALHFLTGRRRKFWHRNCLALGLSSGFLEPLESTSIHLIQSGISRLLTMFPDRQFDQALIDEYNRASIREFEGIRDFLILHYHANGRHGEAFWDERRGLEIPESLVQRMTLFARHGLVSRQADELFTEGSWLQVLLGQCGVPERVPALAAAMHPDQVGEVLNVLAAAVQRNLQRMPEHAEFIARHCRAS